MQPLMAFFDEGHPLAGGYQVVEIDRPPEPPRSLWVEGPDGRFHVAFQPRDDDAPFFVQTTHCNIVYRSDRLDEGAQTPAGLQAALTQLQDAAEARDLQCTATLSFPQRGDMEPVPAWVEPLASPVAPVVIGALFLVLAGIGARIDGSRRTRAAALWLGITAFTAMAAWLRLCHAGVPFCESASTQRIQIGASPVWSLLTGQVADPRHPPLTTLLLHILLQFGKGEAWLRLPFALCSAAAIPLTAALARRHSGPLAALTTAAVCAVLLPTVVQGREIGSHALFHATLPLLLLAYARLRDGGGLRSAAALSAAIGLALWSHHLAWIPLVMLTLDGALLAPSGARRRLLTATGAGVILGLPALLALARGLAADHHARVLATVAPDVVWGNKSLAAVATEAMDAVGMPIAAALLLGALLGSLGLRRASPPLVAIAWLLPLAVIAATPWQRMRGIYATLTLPLLSLLAAHAAAKVPPRAGRWLPVALSGLLVALALGTAWQGGPPTILQPACTADTQAVATAIRSTGIRHLALPSGHSATLVGFYLSDAVVPERAAETSPSASEYGEYRIHNLVTPGELSTEWRATAEHALERLVGTHGDLLLLDVQHVEPTWPELEAAGGCEVREEFEGVRLLRCAGDDAAPVNTSRLRPSTASTNQ